MTTSLEYSVLKEEYDFKKDKIVNRIKSRGFAFLVDHCKTEEEHRDTINSFFDFLRENNIESFCFGSGNWNDAIRQNDQKNYKYLDIPLDNETYKEDREYIKEIYKEWKVLERKKKSHIPESKYILIPV